MYWFFGRGSVRLQQMQGRRHMFVGVDAMYFAPTGSIRPRATARRLMVSSQRVTPAFRSWATTVLMDPFGRRRVGPASRGTAWNKFRMRLSCSAVMLIFFGMVDLKVKANHPMDDNH